MTRRRSDIRARGSAAAVALVAALCAGMVAYLGFGGDGGSASASPGVLRLAGGSTGTRDLDLRPLDRGDSAVARCVSIQYTGARDGHLRLYARAGGPLADYLDVKVERGGQPESSASCSAFRAEEVVFAGKMGSFPRAYSTGLGGNWSPGESRVYRISAAVDDAVGDRGAGSEIDFTWEAR